MFVGKRSALLATCPCAAGGCEAIAVCPNAEAICHGLSLNLCHLGRRRPCGAFFHQRLRKVFIIEAAVQDVQAAELDLFGAVELAVRDQAFEENAGLLAAGDGAPAIRRHNCLGSAATTSDRT